MVGFRGFLNQPTVEEGPRLVESAIAAAVYNEARVFGMGMLFENSGLGHTTSLQVFVSY